MELEYQNVGDYLLPELTAPQAPKIGKYGMLRRSYLREHRDSIYTGLLLSGRLNRHLEDADKQANELMNLLTKQMAAAQGVNEALKAADQMAWVGRMNSIRAAAEETVFREIVYK